MHETSVLNSWGIQKITWHSSGVTASVGACAEQENTQVESALVSFYLRFAIFWRRENLLTNLQFVSNNLSGFLLPPCYVWEKPELSVQMKLQRVLQNSREMKDYTLGMAAT